MTTKTNLNNVFHNEATWKEKGRQLIFWTAIFALSLVPIALKLFLTI